DEIGEHAGKRGKVHLLRIRILEPEPRIESDSRDPHVALRPEEANVAEWNPEARRAKARDAEKARRQLRRKLERLGRNVLHAETNFDPRPVWLDFVDRLVPDLRLARGRLKVGVRAR